MHISTDLIKEGLEKQGRSQEVDTVVKELPTRSTTSSTRSSSGNSESIPASSRPTRRAKESRR
jgi:Rod binding domain-containing protein